MSNPPVLNSPVLGAGSDASYSTEGDAYDGTPVKVAPSGGQLAQGVRPGRQLAAQHQNWKESQYGLIFQALIESLTVGASIAVVEFLGDSGGGSALYEWVVPPRAGTIVLVDACGGGGGGGGGHGNTGPGVWLAGGGGGGGALRRMLPMPVTPGSTITIVPGAGGAGGAAGQGGIPDTNGFDGADGVDTILTVGVTELLRFHGGGKGRRGEINADPNHPFGMGGSPNRLSPSHASESPVVQDPHPYALVVPGHGGVAGDGQNGVINSNGAAQGAVAGGTAGARNSTVIAVSTGYRGGGGGGGGGAGGFGPGGAGGSGGAPTNSGGPTTADAGSDAPDASGGGGGGGGSCGAANSGNSFAGDGGRGGSGRVRIYYLIRPLEEVP